MNTIDSRSTRFVSSVLLLGGLLVVPPLDGSAAAQTNFRFIANATWTTDEAVSAMRGQ